FARGLRRVGEERRVRARAPPPECRGSGEQPERALVVRRGPARGAGDRLTLAAESLHWLLDFHHVWAYVALGANALAGLVALIAWRRREWRGRWVWWCTVAAEAAILLQVLVGVILVASKEYVAPRFHMFYGFLAFLTVGLAYSYRRQMQGRREMLY